jgi:hypothetical protein
MIKIPNKLVIFGAVAAAALAVPGVLGPLFQEAAAAPDQSNRGTQNAVAGIAALNLGVNANVNAEVEDNEVAACAVLAACDIDQ